LEGQMPGNRVEIGLLTANQRVSFLERHRANSLYANGADSEVPHAPRRTDVRGVTSEWRNATAGYRVNQSLLVEA
jgi:hypothetical protein